MIIIIINHYKRGNRKKNNNKVEKFVTYVLLFQLLYSTHLPIEWRGESGCVVVINVRNLTNEINKEALKRYYDPFFSSPSILIYMSLPNKVSCNSTIL